MQRQNNCYKILCNSNQIIKDISVHLKCICGFYGNALKKIKKLYIYLYIYSILLASVFTLNSHISC